MTKPSKEHILRTIRQLAQENGGAPVGKRRFEEITGIRERDWAGIYWARWSEAVREAGYEPLAWNSRQMTDNQLLEILARATRDLGRFPTGRELEMRRQTVPAVPTVQVFSTRLGPRVEQIRRLIAYGDSNREYADVAEMCSALLKRAPEPKVAPPAAAVTGAVYLIQMGEFHKIGKTNDAKRRLYDLGLRLPEKHDLIHLIETDDPSGIEAYWHRRFAAQRANGEWFKLAPSDVAAFRRRTYQ